MSYIVPRDKPKRCTQPRCRFMDRDTLDCRLQDKSWESFEEQYAHCPLIEIPTPHGRLGDLDKLKAYEDKRSDRIEVGDEVRAEEGHVFVVTGITDKGSIYGFDKDGMWLVRVKNRLCKTGKHYDIASILEAMRE